MKGIAWLALTIVIGQFCTNHAVDSPWIAGHKLGQEISNFSQQALGIKRFQEILRDYMFDFGEIDGKQVLDKISSTIYERFHGSMDAVRNLKKALESGFDGGDFSDDAKGFVECCKEDDADKEWHSKYGTKVNHESLCYRLSPDTPEGSTYAASKAVLDKLRENQVEGPSIRWQYFGSVDGSFTTYPARLQSLGCDAYDPRNRPWYVETAAPVPKDIVIVLDKSESMGKPVEDGSSSRISLAIEAAQNVLGTLNANDRVGIVLFSHTTDKPTGQESGLNDYCFYSHLALAIPENIEYLKSFLSTVKAEGNSYYSIALKAAFGYFGVSDAENQSDRRRTILFITDGLPKTETKVQIMDVIYSEMAKLNNSVTILTFGIGSGTFEERARILLEEMATVPNITLTPAQRDNFLNGTFTLVPIADRLSSSLLSYYTVFQDVDVNPIVTVPYEDKSGLGKTLMAISLTQSILGTALLYNAISSPQCILGLVVSICLPVYQHQPTFTLRGVTCVDVSIDELASDVTFFNHGQHSYSFLFDTASGKTLLHPLLPRPQDGRSVPLDVALMESDTLDIIMSMKRGGNGTRHVPDKKMPQSRGLSTQDGVQAVPTDVTYLWSKIPNTTFTVAVVIANEAAILKVTSELLSKHFIYHRLDLAPEGSVTLCRVNNILVTYNGSTVFFTASAFVDPFLYTHEMESTQTFKRYTAEMEGNLQPSDIFRDGVRDLVAITERMDEYWLADSEYAPYIVQRYIGTVQGFIRVYPGIPLPENYDHTKRRWYQMAVANKGKTVVTPPYEDAFGGGEIVTVAYTVDVLNPSTNERHMIGVIAMDLRPTYLDYMIQRVYPACQEDDKTCLILDSNGYVIFHEQADYITTQSHVPDVHVTDKEPDVAQDLIDDGLMKDHICNNFATRKQYHTWRLEMSTPVEKWTQSPYYDMDSVDDTNLFIGIKGNRANWQHCRGHTGTECGDKKNDERCFAPCSSRASFHYCNNSFTFERDEQAPCVPGLTVNFTLDLSQANRIFPSCSRTCNMSGNQAQCVALIGCTWCDGDDQPHFCSLECNDRTPAPISAGVLGGAVGGGVALLLALVIAVAAILHRRRARRAADNATTYLDTDGHLSDDTRPSTVRSSSVSSEVHYESPSPGGRPPMMLPGPDIITVSPSCRDVAWSREEHGRAMPPRGETNPNFDRPPIP